MSDKDRMLELYKLEYDKAAVRYEDIYKAVWQNFSYMAVLAGAILTFGRNQLGTTVAALLACTPLLVWFWATYEPLNRYGDRVETRLTVEPTGRLNITKSCLQVVAQGDPQSLSLLLQEIARVQCNQGRSN